MARSIVTDHGGQIEVASAPGRGAIFRIVLLAAAVDPEA
jgi:signal transduction histidine kinase